MEENGERKGGGKSKKEGGRGRSLTEALSLAHLLRVLRKVCISPYNLNRWQRQSLREMRKGN